MVTVDRYNIACNNTSKLYTIFTYVFTYLFKINSAQLLAQWQFNGDFYRAIFGQFDMYTTNVRIWKTAR